MVQVNKKPQKMQSLGGKKMQSRKNIYQRQLQASGPYMAQQLQDEALHHKNLHQNHGATKVPKFCNGYEES